MQGKIVTKLSENNTNYDLVLLVSVIEDAIVVNGLTHRPLFEM